MHDQAGFSVRCEWGEEGVRRLAPLSDAVIIVDVMSFSTAVSVATARGATVFPYRWKDDARVIYAASLNAELAGPRGQGQYSLSPLSLQALTSGSRIVLPSPNGATLSLATSDTPTFAGCLRNARAVAEAAMACGPTIAVIACGERWESNGALRPAYEDWLGAGAIIAHLAGSLSPEAEAALAVFERARDDLQGKLAACASGQELVERGYAKDIASIAALNSDKVAPRLQGKAYIGNLGELAVAPMETVL